MKWLHPRVKLRGALEGESAERVWKKHLWDLKPVYIFGIVSVLLTTLAEVVVPYIVKDSIDTLSNVSTLGSEGAESKFTRYFLILLDEQTRTVQLGVVHPSAIPTAAAPLLPNLPAEITDAVVRDLIALRLPE